MYPCLSVTPGASWLLGGAEFLPSVISFAALTLLAEHGAPSLIILCSVSARRPTPTQR